MMPAVSRSNRKDAMKTDYDPDHYRTPRTLPHSGSAIEGPEEDGSAFIGLFWAAACIIVMLLGCLMIYEAFR